MFAQQYVFNKQWDFRYGGGLADEITAIDNTQDGGFIIGGSSQSGISGDKTQENWDTTYQDFDYWVVRADNNGQKVWDKRFGGKLQDNLYVIQFTTDGGFILGGSSSSYIFPCLRFKLTLVLSVFLVVNFTTFSVGVSPTGQLFSEIPHQIFRKRKQFFLLKISGKQLNAYGQTAVIFCKRK